MIGRPIFDYPPEFRAPQGEGCLTCGIQLEADAIGSYCSPECCEWRDRCETCQRGPTWCTCAAPVRIIPVSVVSRDLEEVP